VTHDGLSFGPAEMTHLNRKSDKLQLGEIPMHRFISSPEKSKSSVQLAFIFLETVKCYKKESFLNGIRDLRPLFDLFNQCERGRRFRLPLEDLLTED
jgi:hypothetical protein